MANGHMGQMIAALRKEKNLTQQDLAAQLNITDKAVSKWERGLAYPDITLVPQLASILGVTTDALLTGTTSQGTVLGPLKTVTKNEWLYIVVLCLHCVGIAMAAGCLLLSLLQKMNPADLLKLLSVAVLCMGVAALFKKGI